MDADSFGQNWRKKIRISHKRTQGSQRVGRDLNEEDGVSMRVGCIQRPEEALGAGEPPVALVEGQYHVGGPAYDLMTVNRAEIT